MQPYLYCRCFCLSLILFAASLSTGCAVSSVFNPYPNQAQDYRAAINSQAAVDEVLKDLESDRDSADAMLYMMERARISQLAGRFDESRKDYQQVIDGFEAQDLAATVQVSKVGAQGASLLTNDNAIPYEGAGYERIFVHHQQALNYWAKGDIEGAAVEFRKVALEQRVLEQRYESEIAEAHQEARQNQVPLGEASEQLVGLDLIAGQVKSSFQNAYTFYQSAAFWEATGELNNALVDYKKALEINPQSDLIASDIARVSSKLGMSVGKSKTNTPEKDEGTVVLLYEDGFVPARTEIKISVPNFSDGGIITIAFPFYDTQNWPKSTPLSVVDDLFNDFGSTDPLVDFGALAVKDLKEQMPAMMVRQVLRGFAKNELQRQSGEQMGAAAQFVANIYNIVSESADRRSWLTIPHTGQALRMNLKEGQRELSLRAMNVTRTLPIEVKAGRTVFVRVVHVNNALIPQVFPL